MVNRVVVTGMGAVTPVGIGLETYWNGLLGGRSGVSRIQSFDPGQHDCQIAAEIPDFDPSLYMDRKEARRLARFIQFGLAASREALQHSGLNVNGNNAERIGVFIGSGIGGIEVMEENHRTYLERGPSRVSPFLVPAMIPNMAAGQVAIVTGARGPNICQVTACASSAHSLGDALRVLQRGEADAMIAGGAEAAVTPLTMAGFCSAKALSTRNDQPEKASRPFDAGRDGFVMGEGAGVLILETLEHARQRGARIFAELSGYAMTGDAYHMTAPRPDGEGVVRAMQLALQDASLSPADVGYINAHGTSTPLNDRLETAAIKQFFGDHAYRLVVSSTKSMTGHLLGAAGAIEAIACVMALYEGKIPPTINYETPDPDCDLNYAPNRAIERLIRVALSSSLGFGGHNAVLVMKRWEE